MSDADRAFDRVAGRAHKGNGVVSIRMVRTPGGRFREVRGVPTLNKELPKAGMAVAMERFAGVSHESMNLLLGRIFAGDIASATGRIPAKKKVAGKATPEKSDWPKLSGTYINWKAQAGLDGRAMLATGDYVEHVEVTEDDEGYRVGLRPGRHKPSGLPIKVVARMLDRGSAKHKIPARPHWGPTVKLVIKRFKRLRPEVRKEVLDKALGEV